jgi:ATP/maltotriose-dependent transcriptional regulator MalT
MIIRLHMAELEFQKGNGTSALELVNAIDVQALGSRANQRIIGLRNGAAYRIVLGDISGARRAARDAMRLARVVQLLNAAISMQHLGTVRDAASRAARRLAV